MDHPIARSGRRRARVITPEGLPLSLEIAPLDRRVTAFLVDTIIMLIAIVLVIVVALMAASGAGEAVGHIVTSILMLAIFAIRNGYFVCCELFWRGATPGKRMMGLRVVSRQGGPLTTGAVFGRNLLRELEFYLPIIFLVSALSMQSSLLSFTVSCSGAWLLVFLLMPLFNADRCRCGDLVAGTLVVQRPEARLLPDPAIRRRKKRPDPDEDSWAGFVFKPKQLDMYGIKELQVLEEILRHDAKYPQRRDVLRQVCNKIVRKIGWSDEVADQKVLPFLKAFYQAQRRHLEERLLLGERREKKRKGRLKKG